MRRWVGPHRDPVLLLVSADALLRQALQTTLTDSGFLVEVARTADDALSLIHESHFDLVVLSIDLPERSGLEVCRQMRSHASELGIVMVTERDSECEMIQALEAGSRRLRDHAFPVSRAYCARAGGGTAHPDEQNR